MDTWNSRTHRWWYDDSTNIWVEWHFEWTNQKEKKKIRNTISNISNVKICDWLWQNAWHDKRFRIEVNYSRLKLKWYHFLCIDKIFCVEWIFSTSHSFMSRSFSFHAAHKICTRHIFLANVIWKYAKWPNNITKYEIIKRKYEESESEKKQVTNGSITNGAMCVSIANELKWSLS